MSITHRVTSTEKKYGFIYFSRRLQHEFLPKGEFTVIAFGERLEKVSLDGYGRMFIGKPLKNNPSITEGTIVVISKISEKELHLDVAAAPEQPSIPVVKSLHEKIVDKWCEEQRAKFGQFEPKIRRNVNINEILPPSISLKENVKTVDGYAVLEIGGVPIHTSVLEVQYKGVREDTVVRVSLILPFVGHVDIIAEDIDDLAKIKELLERLNDPNIIKAKVTFQTFKEYLLKK